MSDLRSEVAAIRARMRLQTILTVGTLVVLVTALGGADVVANVIVDTGWKVKTTNLAGTPTPRIEVTADVDLAKVKIQNANIELYPQASPLPTSGMVAGTIGYDNTASKLKYFNGTAWVEPAGTQHAMAYRATDATTTSGSLVNDSTLKFAIGANEKWTADFWVQIKGSTTFTGAIGVSAPSGATVKYWFVTAPSTSTTPSAGTACKVATNFGSGLTTRYTTTVEGHMIHVCVTNGGTAGDVSFQFCSSGGPTATLMAGSTLEATKLP